MRLALTVWLLVELLSAAAAWRAVPVPAPQLSLEAPADTVTIRSEGGTITGRGWAFSCGDTIKSHTLLVDSVVVSATFTTGVARPDQQAYYQTHGCPSVGLNIGFTVTFSGDGISTGSHIGGLIVTDSLGQSSSFGHVFMLQKLVPDVAWTTVAPLPVALSDLAAVGTNGKVYAMGGKDAAGCAVGEVRAYDPSTNAWATVTALPTPRSALNAVVLNGVIYAIGGTTGCGSSAVASQVVEAYTIATNTWNTKAALPDSTAQRAAIAAAAGKIYAANHNTSYVYDPSGNQWTSIAGIPEGLGTADHLLGGTLGDAPFAMGGQKQVCFFSFCPAVKTVWTHGGTWNTASSLLNGRLFGGVTDSRGVLYVVGGLTGGTPGIRQPPFPTAIVEGLDSTINQWLTYRRCRTRARTLPPRRSTMSCMRSEASRRRRSSRWRASMPSSPSRTRGCPG